MARSAGSSRPKNFAHSFSANPTNFFSYNNSFTDKRDVVGPSRAPGCVIHLCSLPLPWSPLSDRATHQQRPTRFGSNSPRERRALAGWFVRHHRAPRWSIEATDCNRVTDGHCGFAGLSGAVLTAVIRKCCAANYICKAACLGRSLAESEPTRSFCYP